MTDPLADIHPSTRNLLDYFTYGHLPPHLADISRPFSELAEQIALRSAFGANGPETTAALRKLLEAKDCAVRAALPSR